MKEDCNCKYIWSVWLSYQRSVYDPQSPIYQRCNFFQTHLFRYCYLLNEQWNGYFGFLSSRPNTIGQWHCQSRQHRWLTELSNAKHTTPSQPNLIDMVLLYSHTLKGGSNTTAIVDVEEETNERNKYSKSSIDAERKPWTNSIGPVGSKAQSFQIFFLVGNGINSIIWWEVIMDAHTKKIVLNYWLYLRPKII